MLIQYYADSLGLPRPDYVALGQRYIFLLQKWFRERRNEEVFIIDRSRGGATIKVLFEIFEEDEGYFKAKKDILILHEGICDCAPRPIPLAFRNFISILPDFMKIRIIGLLHRNRARLLKSGLIFYLVGKKEFEHILKEWLEKAANNFERIYIFNIAPTNDQIESHSPGLGKSIKAYNEILRRVVTSLDDSRIDLIDMYSVIANSAYSLDELIIKEDGHHLTALAHRLYAEEIIAREMKVDKN